jgi:transposase-like protein
LKSNSINSEDPETEVPEKARRRHFSAKYKIDILRRAEQCGKKTGALGALLREEGLYSSHLTHWRQQRARGGLEPKKRGPKATVIDERDARIAELERAIALLTVRAERAENLVALQKKVAELLALTSPSPGRTD